MDKREFIKGSLATAAVLSAPGIVSEAAANVDSYAQSSFIKFFKASKEKFHELKPLIGDRFYRFGIESILSILPKGNNFSSTLFLHECDGPTDGIHSWIKTLVSEDEFNKMNLRRVKAEFNFREGTLICNYEFQDGRNYRAFMELGENGTN